MSAQEAILKGIHMMTIRRLGLMLFTVLCVNVRVASADADSRVMQIYPLYTPDAAATISVVESVLGAEGRVIYDKPNVRLLVVATEEQQKNVAEILGQLNVPPANIRIEVAMDESLQEKMLSLGVDTEGQVVIDGGNADVNATVTPHVSNRSSRRGRTMKQSLLLQSGGEAVLHIGEEVPYAEWIVNYGVSQGYFPQYVQMREVGAVLRVQARVIGDGPLISLKLTPEISGMSDSGQQTLQFTRLSTDVTVEDGQTLDLGGLSENSEFFQKFLIGLDRNGSQRALTLKVTPRIERMSGAPSKAPVAVEMPEAAPMPVAVE